VIVVPSPDGWEAAFVAMSVAIGARAEDACASLDESAAERVRAFADSVTCDSQEARAKALAAGLAPLAVAVERARLA
jgi:hypothetical protein